MHSHQARWPEPSATAITGAASGIGRAVALRLARPGRQLALADRNVDGLAATVVRCRVLGADVHHEAVDVSDVDAVEDYATRSVERFGRIDAICNIAGVINAGTVEQSTLEDLDHIMAINFGGVVHGTRAFLPHIVAARGAIVNISSAYGLISGPAYSAYNASKFAVRGWTDALRMEMALHDRGVRVITVYPGGIRTPIMTASTSAAGAEDAAARRERFDTRIARTDPEIVAERIVTAITTGRRRVLIGADAYLADALSRVSATAYERLIIRANRIYTVK